MHKYNSNIHNRRSIRLKGYNYSQLGLYFVTICCQNRQCFFGDIVKRKMILNDAGEIALQCWLEIPQHFSNVFLHEFVIMPNHVHGIIEIGNITTTNGNGTIHWAPNDTEINHLTTNGNGTIHWATARVAPTNTVGDIIGAYKSFVANRCLEIYKLRNEYMGKLWQRNYYEHIIRNEQSYKNITNYIINNPANWRNSKLYVF
jgi:REP element-mobilizing transposase RayT